MTKLHELAEIGQSVWLDHIDRNLITSGKLQELIDTGLRGMTSNPNIFNQAIAKSDAYDQQLQTLVAAGKSVEAIYEALVVQDIQNAADVLRPVYGQTDGLDGYVSLEANPHLAYDTQGTIDEVHHLRAAVDRPNVMYKVPATPEGVVAAEHLIGEGININITLMFSMNHYESVAHAYITGLEHFEAHGGDITQVASVASFFVSRVDVKVDDRLASMDDTDLQGQIAIANARLVYQRFREIFSHDNRWWMRLSERGARVQRPLWASTSTKNPDYPDTLYVDNLIGPDTVNTMPLETLAAFLDHGTVAQTINQDVDQALGQVLRLGQLGIDLDEVGEELQREGVDKFVEPFDALLETIRNQRERLHPEA
jgi:transaldolase